MSCRNEVISMRKRVLSLLVSLAVGTLFVSAASPGQAQNRWHHSPHGHDFHGRDYYRFSPYERRLWVGGHWIHDWHDGRFAWWWVADDFWYFYPEPVYPYPTYVPPAVIVQQPPPMPSGAPPAQYWYYCDSPSGYYPYVASCNGPWRPVPSAPPANSAPSSQSSPGTPVR